MKALGYVAIGAAVGLLVGLKFRASESFCCGLVADAARDKVRDKLGDTAGDVFDLFNLGGAVPPFLQATGLRP